MRQSVIYSFLKENEGKSFNATELGKVFSCDNRRLTDKLRKLLICDNIKVVVGWNCGLSKRYYYDRKKESKK